MAALKASADGGGAGGAEFGDIVPPTGEENAAYEATVPDALKKSLRRKNPVTKLLRMANRPGISFDKDGSASLAELSAVLDIPVEVLELYVQLADRKGQRRFALIRKGSELRAAAKNGHNGEMMKFIDEEVVLRCYGVALDLETARTLRFFHGTVKEVEVVESIKKGGLLRSKGFGADPKTGRLGRPINFYGRADFDEGKEDDLPKEMFPHGCKVAVEINVVGMIEAGFEIFSVAGRDGVCVSLRDVPAEFLGKWVTLV